MSYTEENTNAVKMVREAELAMTIARKSPTQANIDIARKAWDDVPSNCGYEIDVIVGHEELDELRVICK